MSRDGSDALDIDPEPDVASGATGRTARDARERQRGDLYRSLMQAPFPVAIVRGSGHVIELANPQMLRAWGKEANIIGLSLLEAMPALIDQPFLGYLDEVLRTGVTYEGHEELARLLRGNNRELEELYFNFVYGALRDSHGAIDGILITAFDVTEQVLVRKQLERALAEARRERERAATLAAQFSTTSERLHGAQEVGNIGIFDWYLPSDRMIWSRGRWATALLKDGGDREQLEHDLGMIERSARTQSRLVSDLFDFSQIVSGKLRLTITHSDATQVIWAAVEAARRAAEAKGVRLDVELDPRGRASRPKNCQPSSSS